MGTPWKPIEDLGPAVESSNPELAALRRVWSEQRESLERDGLLDRYTERLCRSWAIETGILERLYTLDRGVTTLLIEKGIDAALIPHDSTDRDPDQVAQMIRDHQASLEGIFGFVKGGRPLSTSYIRELHASLTRSQSRISAIDARGRPVEPLLLHGEYKQQPNNPTRPDGVLHEYAPPEQVTSEMDRLVAMHLQHTQREVAPEVEAAWLHHRFTQIHPFQDGNGRVARALASLVMIRAGLFPVAFERDDRSKYIESLEKADDGDLGPLVELIARVQTRSLLQALQVAGEVKAGGGVEQVLEAARSDLEQRARLVREKQASVRATTLRLLEFAHGRFKDIERFLKQTLRGLEAPRTEVTWAKPGDEKDHWFRHQIVATAKRLDYFADLGADRAWVRLAIGRDPQHNVLVSFHGLGKPFRGIMAASSCSFLRAKNDEGVVETENASPLCDEVFQFNDQDTEELAEKRFRPWVERTLVQGLERWRKSL